MKIRVSLATASLLGLKKCYLKAKPTTLYFLLDGKCKGNCSYCYQKIGYLARVKWPKFNLNDVKEKLEKVERNGIGRICIQSIYNPYSIEKIVRLVNFLNTNIPFSVSINAISKEKMKILKENGIERIGIGLDCFTENLFNKWKKGVPSWREYINALDNAKKIFGYATCHLIVGLGENDYDAIKLMKNLYRKGIEIALFAYCKKNETMVDLPRYRVLQLARYFIGKGKFYFKNKKIVEMELPYFEKKAFMTSGCPNCNRPFYNERVTKIYNYPYELKEEEAKFALEEAKKYARIYFTSE